MENKFKKMAGAYRLQALLLILVVITVGYVVMQSKSGDRDEIKVGETAPDFVLTDLNGDEKKLSDYRGRGVLLNFWASWCNPCVNELPLFNEAYKQMKGVEVVGVNMGENEETVKKFAKRYDLEFPVLLDTDNSVKKQYVVSGLPVTLLIDSQGKIIKSQVGGMDDFERIWELMKSVQSPPSANK